MLFGHVLHTNMCWGGSETMQSTRLSTAKIWQYFDKRHFEKISTIHSGWLSWHRDNYSCMHALYGTGKHRSPSKRLIQQSRTCNRQYRPTAITTSTSQPGSTVWKFIEIVALYVTLPVSVTNHILWMQQVISLSLSLSPSHSPSTSLTLTLSHSLPLSLFLSTTKDTI